jgi:DNA topoisomerase I
MKLVIVESPTKAKTISKFLGKEYRIESSFGHIRDLPKSEMGIDIENGFIPKYVIPLKSKKTVSKLKEAAEKADAIILASDEDREGEAIAWHLIQALESSKSKKKSPTHNYERIVFHEITKNAILHALETPRQIDLNLVDAQQARRVLDRLVGYKLSPFLWKKVVKGLSAGRVQSVAVRLVVEREREIQNFKQDEYWSIEAELLKKGDASSPFLAKLNRIEGKTIDKLFINNEEQAGKITRELDSAEYTIADIERKETKKNPPSPFTTSTLQQTANRWLGFSAKQTMRLAQQLYEGIEIAGEGQVGLITYMRTDSLNLSDKFLSDAKNYIDGKLGEKYSMKTPRKFKTKSKGAQEAHEAIRPTEASRDPESVQDSLDSNQYKLYKLIWQRALAGQMKEAVIDSTAIDVDTIKNGTALPYQFRATGQMIRFKGFLEIYPEKSAETELPSLSKGEVVDLSALTPKQHFTQPPARYSDAGLVKTLERYGIGRPSTYAPTIATIEDRNYVNRDENKRLAPTEIAFIVNDLLVKHFPDIVDMNFTAQMENNLDDIADGKSKWQPVIEEFYNPFEENLQKKYKEINKEDIMPEEKTDEICDKCGAPMIIKAGRYGKFLACSAFPECKNAKPLNGDNTKESGEKSEKTKELEEKYKDEVCDKCGSPMVIKVGRFGPFLACTGYPKCKRIKNIKENNNGSTGIACTVCGEGEIVAKKSRRGIFYACNRYPDCKTSYAGKPTGDKCEKCGSLLIDLRGNIKCSNKDCGK